MLPAVAVLESLGASSRLEDCDQPAVVGAARFQPGLLRGPNVAGRLGDGHPNHARREPKLGQSHDLNSSHMTGKFE